MGKSKRAKGQCKESCTEKRKERNEGRKENTQVGKKEANKNSALTFHKEQRT